MNKHLMRYISQILIASVFTLSLPFNPAHAQMVTTDQVATANQGQNNRERIREFLDRKDVRAQLENQGINPDEAKTRVAALTDDEVQQIAGKLDKMPAGGDGILGALVFIFIVLLVTDILGLTKVFPFTKPIRK